MLEQQDYNQIKDIFNVEGKKIFEEEGEKLEKRIVNQIGKVIEDNIIPAIEGVIERKTAQLPDKAFLTDKLVDLEGGLVLRQKKEDKKVNMLIEFLQNKKVLLDKEVNMLNEIQVFSEPPEINPEKN